jgi:protein TonB
MSLLTLAQEAQSDNGRAIVSRVVPIYPELARKVNLEGTVKLQVTVAPNGTVKSAQAVGGSPVLVKAAEDAIYKWRWIPAKQESKELVEIRFRPE